MTAGAGLVVLLLALVGLNLAAWAFGADSRDPCDRDPFLPDVSRDAPCREGRRG